MPKRRPAEVEEEVEIKKEAPKKETFVTRWFKDNAVNNAEDLKIVCELTVRSAYEQFFLDTRNLNCEVFGVIFYATFLTILDNIREKQKKYNKFTVEIANSVNIGYTNDDDEDNEKVGNFMPIMEYIGINRKIIDPGKLKSDSTATNATTWKEMNAKSNADFIKKVEEETFDRCDKEYRVNYRTSELTIPLFCIFLDNIIGVLKMKFKEAQGTDVSEVSMNVFGLFDVFYSFNADDNQEIIEFQPNIRMKLRLKNDEVASRE
jgi:hypothetical protein